MRTLFADTGYWFALLLAQDPLHQRAMALSQQVASARIVTTQMMLTELVNLTTRIGLYQRQRGLTFIQQLENSPQVEIIPQTADQFQQALTFALARPDQRWSLTDCASFLTMERLGIREALAHDRHFQQAGFVPLLREGAAG